MGEMSRPSPFKQRSISGFVKLLAQSYASHSGLAVDMFNPAGHAHIGKLTSNPCILLCAVSGAFSFPHHANHLHSFRARTRYAQFT